MRPPLLLVAPVRFWDKTYHLCCLLVAGEVEIVDLGRPRWPAGGPRRPGIRAQRCRFLGRGRPRVVLGTRRRLADAVEVETRSDGDRPECTEAELGDLSPKTSRSTQICPEDQPSDPMMGSGQSGYRYTRTELVFGVPSTASTAQSRGILGPSNCSEKKTTATERLPWSYMRS